MWLLMNHLRNRILNVLFDLLYGRLVFFHEPAGNALFGESWHKRRLWCLADLPAGSMVVDVGAGEGRLVDEARRRGIRISGFDPSRRMRESASRRGVQIAAGTSYGLPLEQGSVGRVVVTYPGKWIGDERTWVEFDRVLDRPGEVRILVGGSYESGSGARVRSTLVRLAYGSGSRPKLSLPAAKRRGFIVKHVRRRDRWGTAHYYVAGRPDA